MAESKRDSRGVGDLTVKINVDVSEALTGLKAIQREAREATKALRELETYYESEGKRYADGDCTDMSDIPTKYLHRELAKREGVMEFSLCAEDSAVISFDQEFGKSQFNVRGPARILVNTD